MELFGTQPERELELGILVIVSLSSNYLFLYHVTPPLELFKFRGIGGLAPEPELHPNPSSCHTHFKSTLVTLSQRF